MECVKTFLERKRQAELDKSVSLDFFGSGSKNQTAVHSAVTCESESFY